MIKDYLPSNDEVILRLFSEMTEPPLNPLSPSIRKWPDSSPDERLLKGVLTLRKAEYSENVGSFLTRPLVSTLTRCSGED